jgi:hypothetical protein
VLGQGSVQTSHTGTFKLYTPEHELLYYEAGGNPPAFTLRWKSNLTDTDVGGGLDARWHERNA